MMIQIHESLIADDYNGACKECGCLHFGGIEPDAENYPCEACGMMEVYGLEQLLVMGLIELIDD